MYSALGGSESKSAFVFGEGRAGVTMGAVVDVGVAGAGCEPMPPLAGAAGVEAPSNNGEGPPTTDQIAGSVPGPTGIGGNTDDELMRANSTPDLRAVGQNLRNRAAAGATG